MLLTTTTFFSATPTLALLGLGPWEIGIIAVIALLIFGRRLPEVMRSMGKGVVEFKRGLRDIEEDAKSASEPEQRIAPHRPHLPHPPSNPPTPSPTLPRSRRIGTSVARVAMVRKWYAVRWR